MYIHIHIHIYVHTSIQINAQGPMLPCPVPLLLTRRSFTSGRVPKSEPKESKKSFRSMLRGHTSKASISAPGPIQKKHLSNVAIAATEYWIHTPPPPTLHAPPLTLPMNTQPVRAEGEHLASQDTSFCFSLSLPLTYLHHPVLCQSTNLQQDGTPRVGGRKMAG